MLQVKFKIVVERESTRLCEFLFQGCATSRDFTLFVALRQRELSKIDPVSRNYQRNNKSVNFDLDSWP